MNETQETIALKQGLNQAPFSRKYVYANGKRKTAVSRVRLYQKGNGEIVINGLSAEKYCTHPTEVERILTPLKLTNLVKNFNISVVVKGGGHSAQSEAIRHGIAKALIEYDRELRTTLKKHGLLTRDSRVKERKKYGRKRARRGQQFSKR